MNTQALNFLTWLFLGQLPTIGLSRSHHPHRSQGGWSTTTTTSVLQGSGGRQEGLHSKKIKEDSWNLLDRADIMPWMEITSRRVVTEGGVYLRFARNRSNGTEVINKWNLQDDSLLNVRQIRWIWNCNLSTENKKIRGVYRNANTGTISTIPGTWNFSLPYLSTV